MSYCYDDGIKIFKNRRRPYTMVKTKVKLINHQTRNVPNAIILEMFEFKLKFELFSNFKLSEHLIESAYKITPVS